MTISQAADSNAPPIKLIAFDVDGTLVVHHGHKVVWQLFHDAFVGDPEVGWARFADYQAGRISYAEWVDLDVGGWRDSGARREQMQAIIRRELTVVPAGQATLLELKRRGYALAIVSGTLDLVIAELLPEVPFDYIFSNRLSFDSQGFLSGWQATPFDIDGKARALEHIAAREGISPADCAFVGDHLNDLAAFGAAGFSLAFMPKDDRVADRATVVVRHQDLGLILPYFPPRSRHG